jgi:hypothetical protein
MLDYNILQYLPKDYRVVEEDKQHVTLIKKIETTEEAAETLFFNLEKLLNTKEYLKNNVYQIFFLLRKIGNLLEIRDVRLVEKSNGSLKTTEVYGNQPAEQQICLDLPRKREKESWEKYYEEAKNFSFPTTIRDFKRLNDHIPKHAFYYCAQSKPFIQYFHNNHQLAIQFEKDGFGFDNKKHFKTLQECFIEFDKIIRGKTLNGLFN